MKKLVALVVVALSCGAWAADSYLYWMVETSVTCDNESFNGYNSAKIGYLNDSGSMTYLNLYGEGESGDFIGIGQSATPGYESFAKIPGSGSTFFIELFNDSRLVAQSEALSYSALESYITSSMLQTPREPWTSAGTKFTSNVPEPSSALLMLLGCAGLALKRKKQAKA